MYPEPLLNDEDAHFDPVSVLHGRILEAYQAIPPQLRNLSEFELCAEADPGPSEYKMRQNFADALHTAKTTGKKFRTTTIFEDVVARQTFFDLYVPSDIKMAFITRPVVPHHAYYDAIFKEGLRKMFIYVKSHDVDAKTIATFARIVDKAGDRVIGAVAQQVNMNQKQLVVHASTQPEQDVTPEDPDAIEFKIREMQAKLAKVKSPTLEINARTIITNED